MTPSLGPEKYVTEPVNRKESLSKSKEDDRPKNNDGHRVALQI